MPAYTTFDQVWRKIDGDKKSTMTEIVEALQEEISSRASLAAKLFKAQKFETLTSVEQERNSFVQVQYGIQDLPYLDNGNESDLWKTALAKRPEIEEREKEARARWKVNTTAWSELIDERKSEIEDAIWKASSRAQEGVPGKYEAIVRLGGQSMTVYKVTRRKEERDVENERFEMSSSKAKQYIEAWKGRFLETDVAKNTAPQRDRDKSHADAMAQEAQKEKTEAQRASEILSGAAAIPRGMDSNLPNADLNFEQEAILSSIDKANTEIKDMRSAATAKEASAASQSRQSNTADATALAKQKMGKETIVTSAKSGREYSGKIIGMTGVHPDTLAIQRISGNQAVLHKIKDLATESNIAVGSDLSITKGKDGKLSVKTQEDVAKEKEAQKNIGEERVR